MSLDFARESFSNGVIIFLRSDEDNNVVSDEKFEYCDEDIERGSEAGGDASPNPGHGGRPRRAGRGRGGPSGGLKLPPGTERRVLRATADAAATPGSSSDGVTPSPLTPPSGQSTNASVSQRCAERAFYILSF